MNLDKLFKEDAFKNVDENLLESFKNLSEEIKGKGFNETLDLIIKFSESMPKNQVLSESEKNAIISAMLNSLNTEERNRFKSMLEMLG